MTVYRSKIGKGIVAIIVISFGLPAYFLAQEFNFIAAIILAVTAALIAYLFSKIRYEINGNELKIHGDLANSKPIEITSIRSIKETNNPIASPAASLDRLEITFGKVASKVLISPKNKAGFIEHLLQINPDIKVVYRNKPASSQPAI